ncbi:hypothetical protein, partial [Streptomyces sp. NPDC046727]|uniref:hypothetical protein n=1 Tax=Streptomyces sp. NPDC046727 TaxID=3155373 RepID=UPI0033EFC029
MSTPEQQSPAGGGPAPDQPPADSAPADEARTDGTDEESEERDQPQDAWSARRDLVDHSPRSMSIGARAR